MPLALVPVLGADVIAENDTSDRQAAWDGEFVGVAFDLAGDGEEDVIRAIRCTSLAPFQRPRPSTSASLQHSCHRRDGRASQTHATAIRHLLSQRHVIDHDARLCQAVIRHRGGRQKRTWT
jgi:hypothetical protein